MFQHSALARTYMSHDVLQEKMLYCSELVGFGSHHEFWNELTLSTEVPPYVIYWKRQNDGDNKNISGCQGLGEGRMIRQNTEDFQGQGNIL